MKLVWGLVALLSALLLFLGITGMGYWLGQLTGHDGTGGVVLVLIVLGMGSVIYGALRDAAQR